MKTPFASEPRDRRWVSIANEQNALPVSEEEIREVCLLTLELENVGGGVEIALVDDVTIADLHERFLKKTGPTDVLTFPSGDAEPGKSDSPGGSPATSLGEVVVSTETACRQAPDYLGDPIREVLLYVIHGVLHLVGYDDTNAPARARMEARQSEVLARWETRKAQGE